MRVVSRAEQLVGYLQEHEGEVWGPLALSKFTLTSPPDTWPPTIRVDYTYEGEARVDEGLWPDVGVAGMSVRAEAELMLGIFHAHLAEQRLI